jgi:hypothetical protein
MEVAMSIRFPRIRLLLGALLLSVSLSGCVGYGGPGYRYGSGYAPRSYGGGYVNRGYGGFNRGYGGGYSRGGGGWGHHDRR